MTTMGDVDQRLRHAALDLLAEVDRFPIPDPPGTGRSRAGRVATGVTVAAMVTAGFLLATPPRDDRPEPGLLAPASPENATQTTSTEPLDETTRPPEMSLPVSGPIFGQATGVLLLFDDGLEGLTAVDPDRRLADRSPVDGQRPGDEPYSMVRVGDVLVVGWSRIYAVDIADRHATDLGAATIFVPAAEDDRVWMIDYPSGRTVGRPEVWQVGLNGEPLDEPTPMPFDGFPLMGIPGGLVVQTDNGLTLWYPGTGATAQLDGPGPGFVFDTSEDAIVWCAGQCLELVITDPTTLESERFAPPRGYQAFTPPSGPLNAEAISPTGENVAILVGGGDRGDPRGLWILERPTGATTAVTDPDTPVTYLAWSPKGDQIFASSNSYTTSQTVVWRYGLTDAIFSVAVLPVGGAMTPVVIDGSHRDAYIGDPNVSSPTCPSSGGVGNDPTLCPFGF